MTLKEQGYKGAMAVWRSKGQMHGIVGDFRVQETIVVGNQQYLTPVFLRCFSLKHNRIENQLMFNLIKHEKCWVGK